MTLYKPKELSKLLEVSNETLRRWSEEGKLKTCFTDGGHRRYFYETPNVEQRKIMSLVL
jgi:excisionase family DNA binding protein